MGFKRWTDKRNDRYGRGYVNKGYRFRTGDKLYSADGSYYLSFQVMEIWYYQQKR
jgi:hypothetical protein